MSLDQLIDLAITTNTATPTRESFGVALVMVQKVPAGFANGEIRTYTQPADLVADGFAVTDPAYLIASKIKAQNPAPPSFKVCKRTHLITQAIHLTVTDATAGRAHKLTIDGVPISYTVPGSSSVGAVATAIAALVTGGTAGATASATGAVIDIVAAAGAVFDVAGWYSNGMTLANATTDNATATDLAAAALKDTAWYGLLLDSPSPAEYLAASAWAEANGKLFIGDLSDSACTDPASTTDAMYVAKSDTYARSASIFNNTNLLHYSAAAWLGGRLAVDPGSDTWNLKTLAGVAPASLTVNESNAIAAKNGNYYTTIAGINVTQSGVSPSGEWIDQVRGVDWLKNDMQTSIFALLANAQKVPYTDAGADSVRAVVLASLARGVGVGFLASAPAPSAYFPKVATVDPTVRATRKLPGGTFSARLAGAIHTLTIRGSLDV
jgi:hypothetical protein